MTLAAWQQDFRTWLTDASKEAAFRVGADAMRGLSVYQNNYRGQLIECLEDSFPQVRMLLGDEAFLHAAITHVNHHPPHAWTLDAYADARATLQALNSRGRATAILSNGSPGMLAAAVEAAQLGDCLDAVLSVDAVRQYKPRPEVYRLVTDHFGVAPADVLFVSSNRWDVMGACAFGFRAAWVNRGKLPDEYPDLAPGHVLGDLGGLLALA